MDSSWVVEGLGEMYHQDSLLITMFHVQLEVSESLETIV